MTILISALIAVVAAQSALAEQRENKAFNTTNGRTTTSAPSAPRVFTVTSPGGGASANGSGAEPAPAVSNITTNGAIADGGRAFLGAGRPAASRSVTGRAVHRGGKPFSGKAKRQIDGGDPTTPPPSTEEAPPNFSKPGALIRTTGQQPKYEKASDPGDNKPGIGTHTVGAGEIVMNNRKAIDVGRAPSVHIGPKDTPPPPNPVSGGTLYGGGASANSGAAKDNNGSGNNSKGTDSQDAKGNGNKDLEADPTGFNDAF